MEFQYLRVTSRSYQRLAFGRYCHFT